MFLNSILSISAGTTRRVVSLRYLPWGVVSSVKHTVSSSNTPPCSTQGANQPPTSTLSDLASAEWFTVLPRVKMGPNRTVYFATQKGELDKANAEKVFTHLRLVIYPDGGVSRLRVRGKVVV